MSSMAEEATTLKTTVGTQISADVVIVPSVNWSNPVQVGVKRILDCVLSFVLLVLLAPIMVIIALAIMLGSAGPVLYRWRVVGKNGRPFTSWKFRSMVVDADARKGQLLHLNEMSGPVFKLENDPRVTRLGKFLRRYSLDELPQLFSVLLGYMSLVGPRPPLQSEYQNFSGVHKQKLLVKPGITCLWQVSGRNQIQDFDDWVQLDLEYIRSWSLGLDCKILLRTVSVVWRGTGK